MSLASLCIFAGYQWKTTGKPIDYGEDSLTKNPTFPDDLTQTVSPKKLFVANGGVNFEKDTILHAVSGGLGPLKPCLPTKTRDC